MRQLLTKLEWMTGRTFTRSFLQGRNTQKRNPAEATEDVDPDVNRQPAGGMASPGKGPVAVLSPRDSSPSKRRWSIKIAAPFGRRLWWGDFHFANSLARALRTLGQDVVVDTHDTWYRADAASDDVVLVLRGLEVYEPAAHQINLLWLISHPDDVTAAELDGFDHTFAASAGVRSGSNLPTGIETMLPATDAERFRPRTPQRDFRHQVLFVGNTKWRLRPVVRDALAADLPLSVYGDSWTGLLPEGVLRGERIPNKQLARFYSSAGVVLNDHWEDMRRENMLSNRLFDAAACGATAVSDHVAGIDDIFDGAIHTYRRAEELGPLVSRLLANPTAGRHHRLEVAEFVRTHHSFEVRARRLVEVADRIATSRSAHGEDQPTHLKAAGGSGAL